MSNNGKGGVRYDPSKLDSNLKKSTAFIRKLKQSSIQVGTPEQLEGILKDVRTLNLSKYLSEIVSALGELRFKNSEVTHMVKVATHLHERYAEFAPALKETLMRQLQPSSSSSSSSYSTSNGYAVGLVEELVKKAVAAAADTADTAEQKDSAAAFSRLKLLLRFMMELYLAGVFVDDDVSGSVGGNSSGAGGGNNTAGPSSGGKFDVAGVSSKQQQPEFSPVLFSSLLVGEGGGGHGVDGGGGGEMEGETVRGVLKIGPTGAQPIIEVFTRMMVVDKDDLQYLSLVVYLVKRCGDYLMGVIPRSKLVHLALLLPEDKGAVDGGEAQSSSPAEEVHSIGRAKGQDEADVSSAVAPSSSASRGKREKATGELCAREHATQCAALLRTYHLDCVVGSELQQKALGVCMAYYRKAAKALTKEAKKIVNVQRRNRYNVEMKGQLSANETADYEKLIRGFEKLLSNVTALADCLDCDLPEVALKLKRSVEKKMASDAAGSDESATGASEDKSAVYWDFSSSSGVGTLHDMDIGKCLDASEDGEEGEGGGAGAGIDLVSYADGRGGMGGTGGVELDENSVWEDEETRRFYEHLSPIDSVMPSMLFSKTPAANPGDEEGKDSSGNDAVDASTPANEKVKTDENGEVVEEEEDVDIEKDIVLPDGVEMLDDLDANDNGAAGDVSAGLLGASTATEGKDAGGADDNSATGTSGGLVGSAGTVSGSGGSSSNVNMSAVANANAEIAHFLERLSLCVNRELIDKLAVEFCYLNSKLNRRKLVNFVFEIPRSRLEVIPYYCRLIATLNKCLPDVGATIVAKLQREFLWHLNAKNQTNTEHKMKTMRYIGELTKFNIFPKHNCLNIIYKLISEFHHHNIDMVCWLLETCGRYLYRTPVSHARTRKLLETMMKKKSAQHLDGRQQAMVDNAFCYSNPPERTEIEHVEAPPLHQFICWVVYKELNPENVMETYETLCRLDWKDPFVYEFCCKAFTGVWNVNYDNVFALALLMRQFSVLHDDVCVVVVENLLEDIRLGLENNYVKWNQRRLSVVKYLGELFNFGLFELRVVMDTLYAIMCFGRSPMEECEGYSPPKDRADDYFRIVLLCTFLQTVYPHIDMEKKMNGKKIEYFLIYFFRYIWSKKQPIPVDIEFVMNDCFEKIKTSAYFTNLVPEGFQFPRSYEEAIVRVRLLEEELMQKYLTDSAALGSANANVGEESDEDVEDEEDEDDLDVEDDDDDDDDGDESMDEDEEDVSEEEDEEEEDSDEDSDEEEEDEEDEEEEVHLLKKPIQEPDSEDEDFVRQFNSMMSGSVNSRREAPGIQKFDIAIPMHLRSKDFGKGAKQGSNNDNVEDDESTLTVGMYTASTKGITDLILQRGGSKADDGNGIDSEAASTYDEALSREVSSSSISGFEKSTNDLRSSATTKGSGNVIKFALLTRKGAKAQVKEMDVPSDSALAVNMRRRQDEAREEQEEMKRLVLQYEKRSEEEERRALVNDVRGTFEVAPHAGVGAEGESPGAGRADGEGGRDGNRNSHSRGGNAGQQSSRGQNQSSTTSSGSSYSRGSGRGGGRGGRGGGRGPALQVDDLRALESTRSTSNTGYRFGGGKGGSASKGGQPAGSGAGGSASSGNTRGGRRQPRS
eukprot:Nk52_evm8s214 gene=Nk52_evmTU8s214